MPRSHRGLVPTISGLQLACEGHEALGTPLSTHSGCSWKGQPRDRGLDDVRCHRQHGAVMAPHLAVIFSYVTLVDRCASRTPRVYGEMKCAVSRTSPSRPSDTVHASSSHQNQNPK